jgi:SpoIID/LytB domain protein
MNRLSEQPVISVGVMSAPQVSFTLGGTYLVASTSDELKPGRYTVALEGGNIILAGKQYAELTLRPSSDTMTFELHDVCIGIGFHWERHETQRFGGSLSFVADGDKLWAVNKLPIEEYLFCVIASEMSATSSLELLKAHAVVSRSWLMAQLVKGARLMGADYVSVHTTDTEHVRWYDREDHTLFDVCADDHCQRYQGLTRANNDVVRQAIEATRGEVLEYEGEICDARFSKCCGGMTERFETCWEPVEHGYLQSFVDYTHRQHEYDLDLTRESAARAWIKGNPQAFCHTQDSAVLRQVLNSYDRETADFYRWHVSYSTSELSELVKRKSGLDFGEVQSMEVVERGPSGRIVRLRIVGTKRTLVVGKELEIRRLLSESHLYSSAFVVDKREGGFDIYGAGWGHGVGMCQIGAAMMSERGMGYKTILLHYFRRAMLERRW